MFKSPITYLVLLFTVFTQTSFSQVDHSGWNKLLNTHVSSSGVVNYEGFANDKVELEKYLIQIAETGIVGNKKEKLATWINAYNAYTIKLVIDNWPVSSIKDVAGKVGASTPWDYSFANIGGKTYTLNQIEHENIRPKFNEPRIHVAVNCASESCPKLNNKAFTGANLDAQLKKLTKSFINDTSRNKISANSLQLSQIFNWFKDDFTKQGSLIAFINKYTEIQISDSASIDYMEYKWGLNN